MAAKAQSSAWETKNPAVTPPLAVKRRFVSASAREKMVEMHLQGFALRDIAKVLGFDFATIMRHVQAMRREGILPEAPKLRNKLRITEKQTNKPPRNLPSDVEELRRTIADLEAKILSLQTPPRPCPPEWLHVEADWLELERRRQSLGAALPTYHRRSGFTETTMAKNHRPKES